MTLELSPLPGDAVALAHYAKMYQKTAHELESATKSLRRIANHDVTISDAVDEIRAQAESAATATGAIHTRYVGTADALADYAVALDTAKSEADAAIRAHDGAHGDVARWAASRDDYIMLAANAQGEERNDFLVRAARAEENVDIAKVALRAAESRYHDAVAKRDAAANVAIGRIDSAMSRSGLNDSFRDDLKGLGRHLAQFARTHLAPILEAIREVCSAVADALGWVTLVLLVASLALPFLAPLAGALALLGKVLVAAAALATLGLFLMGNESWGELLKSGLKLATQFLPKAGEKFISKIGAKIANKLIPIAQNGVQWVVRDMTYEGIRGVLGKVEGKVEGAGRGLVIDSIPGSDSTLYGAPESAAGPSWSRPPSIEVPEIDPRAFAPAELPQVRIDAIRSAFDSGDVALQGFAGAAR